MMRFLMWTMGVVASLFAIGLIGRELLEEFPMLQEPWNELKNLIGTAYEQSTVKYGTFFTLIIIAGLGFMFASSKR